MNMSGGALQQLLRFAFEFEARVLVGFRARQRGDALHEIEDRFRRPPSSDRTISMTLTVSPFERPRRRRKVSRSSSLRATIRSRAALMPAMNGAGEELAKLVSAGAASCAKRWAANFECRMVISSKFSVPHKFLLAQTARK